MSQPRASSTSSSAPAAAAASSPAKPIPRKWNAGSLAKVPKGDKGDEQYASILATVPRTTNPTCLADFGYEYTADGRLVQQATKAPFAWLGQKHYDFLGEAIVNDLYAMLEARFGLERVPFPAHPVSEKGKAAGDSRVTAPVFVSPGFEKAETLVILCQGSGAVRPGMWARALCINNSLKEGTIFTYLEEIQKRGWAVIVCNPNQSSVVPQPTQVQVNLSLEDACDFWLGTPDPQWKRMNLEREKSAAAVEGCETPMDHICTVWEQLVRPAAAKRVPIIAHSFGGICTTTLACDFPDEFDARVPAIAWTDAINNVERCLSQSPKCPADRKLATKMLSDRMAVIRDRSVNWVASTAKLDTPLRSPSKCVELSAGHDTHEWTSAACWTSVFKFLDKKIGVSTQ